MRPSKGAMKAAEVISRFTALNSKNGVPWAAEVIDRETKSPQMAALLHDLCHSIYDDARMMTDRQRDALVRAERLLSELEVKP